MKKLFPLILCPAFVLVSGLVGCTKEEKKFDVYDPPAPKVIRSGARIEMAAWDNSSNRELDINDSFDVTDAQATRAKFTAICEFGDQTRTETEVFDAPTVVRIFQILPEILLNRDPKQIGLRCQYEIALENWVGSKHVFHIQQSPIADANLGEVEIDGSDNVRFANANLSKAKILCTHVWLEPVYFNQMLPMNAFQFEKYKIRNDFSRETVFENALQTCRVAILENERVTHISNKFKHQFESPGLVLAPGYKVSTDIENQPLEVDANFLLLTRHQPRLLFDYQLINPTTGVRRVKIRKAQFQTKFGFVGMKKGSNEWVLNNIQKPGIFLSTGIAAGASVDEAVDHWIVTFSPNSQVGINVSSNSPWARCDQIRDFAALLISPAEELYVEEVNSNGEFMSKITVPFNGRAFITTNRWFNALPEPLDVTSQTCLEIPH